MKDLKIYRAIKKYEKLSPVRLHMPGHKGRNFLRTGAKFDITELPRIDNAKIVADAEEDCAQILGAKKLFFLTGGSTSGILAALYAVKDLGKKIVINRSAHKSVYNGLKLFGIDPVIIDDEREKITSAKLSEVFEKEKGASAALFTYPDYFGRTFDLKGIKETCEKFGKIFITDSAHGNHFKFIGLPYAGDTADISVESLHKTAYTFNQGAIICVNDLILAEKVSEGVNAFLSTSPSYPLLASVEYGIKRWEKDAARAKRVVSFLLKSKRELEKQGLKILPAEDPFKLTVLFGENGYDGLKVSELIEKKKVFPELAGKNEVLFMASAATKKSDLKKLVRAVRFAIKSVGKKCDSKTVRKDVPRERVMPYLAAVNSEWEYTPTTLAQGKICAENFGNIPPCVPLFTAGEKINCDISERLSGETFGVKDGKIKTVKVK